jgi:hypothetical protein
MRCPIEVFSIADRGTKPPKPIKPVSNGMGPSGMTCVRTAECTPSAPIRKSPSALVPSAFLEVEFDVLAPGLVHDRFVERGAAHIHRGLTEALLHIAVDGTEPASRLRIEIE